MKISTPGGSDHHKLYEAWTMARKLLDYYELEHWTLEFSRSVNTAGWCSPEWMHTIKLSAPIMSIWPTSEVEDTILHEIAHALVGTHHHHDSVWKAKAREIGARPKACYTVTPELEGAFRWIGVCPNGHRYHRQRKPYYNRVSCPKCLKGKFDARYVIEWKKIDA